MRHVIIDTVEAQAWLIRVPDLSKHLPPYSLKQICSVGGNSCTRSIDLDCEPLECLCLRFAVAPDERSLPFSKVDSFGSDLMLVENVR